MPLSQLCLTKSVIKLTDAFIKIHHISKKGIWAMIFNNIMQQQTSNASGCQMFSIKHAQSLAF